jgi:hypothetical protein
MTLDYVIPDLRDSTRVSEQVDLLRRRLLEPDVSRRVGSAREALHLLRDCPSYQSAALELQAIVRWYRQLQPGDPGYHENRIVQLVQAPPAEQAADTSVSRPGSQAVGSASHLPITRRQQLLAAVVLAFAGLCVGCLGVGFAVSKLDGASITEEEQTEPQPPMKTAPSPSLAPSPSPAPAPSPALPPSPLPAPVMPELASADVPEFAPDARPLEGQPGEDTSESVPKELPVVESEVEPEVESEPEPELQPQPKAPPPPTKPEVEVVFNSGTLHFAYVKVGGKRFIVDLPITAKLPPGWHKIAIRKTEDSPWKVVGKIKIQSGRSNTIYLDKIPGVEVAEWK